MGKTADEIMDVADVRGLEGFANALESVIAGVEGVEEHATQVKRGPLWIVAMWLFNAWEVLNPFLQGWPLK